MCPVQSKRERESDVRQVRREAGVQGVRGEAVPEAMRDAFEGGAVDATAGEGARTHGGGTVGVEDGGGA